MSKKSTPETTILTVNYNSADFIAMQLYAFTKLSKNPFRVYILDNNSKLKDFKKLQRIVRGYPNVSLKRRTTDLKGSVAHGTALNILIKKINTPYFALMDADCLWLKKDWDEIMKRKFTNKIKITGTQADSINMQQDFPQQYAIFGNSKVFKSLNIDYAPDEEDKKHDTGWKVRKAYHDKGYKGLVLNMKNTRDYHDGPFNTVLASAEYYLAGETDIYIAHFGRGSNPMGKNMSKNQIPILRSIIKYISWTRDKKTWLTIAKRIIDQEATQ